MTTPAKKQDGARGRAGSGAEGYVSPIIGIARNISHTPTEMLLIEKSPLKPRRLSTADAEAVRAVAPEKAVRRSPSVPFMKSVGSFSRLGSSAPRSSKSGPIARLASTAVPSVNLAIGAPASPHLETWTIVMLVLTAVLGKYAVGLGSHSGEGKGPMYGDYEAQRHWMEITTHLPTNDWYVNTTKNDLLYWGLDYPPGSAYFAQFWGWVAHLLNPSWVALHASRGIETVESKVFMRLSVILSDLVFYVPAALAFAFTSTLHRSRKWAEKYEVAACLLFNPANMLVDHGHFQYNGVSLGMAMGAIVAFDKDWPCMAAFLFSCSLNFKQMNLYLALPFFFGLLSYAWHGGLLRRGKGGRKKLGTTVWEGGDTSCGTDKGTWCWSVATLAKIGATVIGTFALHWAPLCLFADLSSAEMCDAAASQHSALEYSESMTFPVCIDILSSGLHRLFPFNRGLFEDKVSNIWCALDPLLKLRSREVLHPYLPLMAGVCTLLLSLPAAFALLRRPPTTKTFLYACATTGLAFFLCSFQVHEKSILVPLLPITLLAVEAPSKSTLFVVAATFSMWPLLCKDGLAVQYLVLMVGWIVLGRVADGGWPSKLALLGMGVCHLVPLLVNPPPTLPDLWTLMLCVYSCGLFCLFYLYLVIRMFQEISM